MTRQQDIQKLATGNQDAAALCNRNGFNRNQKVDPADQTSRDHKRQRGAEIDLFMNFSPGNALSGGRPVWHCPDGL
jgi:hypothetical protein